MRLCECHASLACDGHATSYRTAEKHGSRLVVSQPAHHESHDNSDRAPASTRPGAPLGPRQPLAPVFTVYAATAPCSCKPDSARLCACYHVTDTLSDTGASVAPLSAPMRTVIRFRQPGQTHTPAARHRTRQTGPRAGGTLSSTMGKNGTLFARNLQTTAPRLGRLETVHNTTRRERRAERRARRADRRSTT